MTTPIDLAACADDHSTDPGTADRPTKAQVEALALYLSSYYAHVGKSEEQTQAAERVELVRQELIGRPAMYLVGGNRLTAEGWDDQSRHRWWAMLALARRCHHEPGFPSDVIPWLASNHWI